MGSYFKSLLAELMPGWAFWRSSGRPTPPLAGSPLDAEVSKRLDEKNRGGSPEAAREKGPASSEPGPVVDAKDRDPPR
jgi:hypothetical protein